MKFPLGVIGASGGHHTCTPGNYPGTVPPNGPICGDRSAEIFVLPGLDIQFKKDQPQITWTAGDTVEVQVNYFLNHAGNYQFRLCLDGSDTEECFKQLPLKFADNLGVLHDVHARMFDLKFANSADLKFNGTKRSTE